MKVRDVFENEKLIGMIAQDINGKIIIRAINDLKEKYIKSLVMNFSIEETVIEAGLSISRNRFITPKDQDFLVYIKYNVPINVYLSELKDMSKIIFNSIKLGE